MIHAYEPATRQQEALADSTFAVLNPLRLHTAGDEPTSIRGVVNQIGELVEAHGIPLLTNGGLGVDLLHVPAHSRFPLHHHPGHHLLYVLKGQGTFTLDGTVYATAPGDLMMIEGSVPHAVGASFEDHVLLAFGSPHTPLDSPRRMTVILEDDDQCAQTIRESMATAGISIETPSLTT